MAHRRSERAREERLDTAFIQDARVIVDGFRGQARCYRWGVSGTGLAADEVVGDFVEGHEAHTGMALNVFDQALKHQQHLRTAEIRGVEMAMREQLA